MAEVFAQTLGLERVGREDDFFDCGGDSLRAVDASLALQQRLGHGLALGAFQHASSVRGLARLLDGAVPSDDLVVLQSSGNATPLICIHGHGGNVFSMRSLARWFPSRSYGIVMRKGKFLSAQARAFVELIKPELLASREYDQSGHSER